MAINADGYFTCLEGSLNTNHYGVQYGSNSVILTEKVFKDKGSITFKVELYYQGRLIAINLDRADEKNNSQKPPLFHFLDNNGKPWSKRCDFVLFNLVGRTINVYCFEFKSDGISADNIKSQLDATQRWCQSLQSIINNYTNQKCNFRLYKFVLTSNQNPYDYLDRTNRFLNVDNTIRLYKYSEINGMNLADLDNPSFEIIK